METLRHDDKLKQAAWTVGKFDGKAEDVRSYLLDLQHLKGMNLSWVDITIILKKTLEGSARKWFNYHYDMISSLDELCTEIEKNFSIDPSEAAQLLSTMSIKPQEHIREFTDRFTDLVDRAGLARDHVMVRQHFLRALHPYTDSSMVHLQTLEEMKHAAITLKSMRVPPGSFGSPLPLFSGDRPDRGPRQDRPPRKDTAYPDRWDRGGPPHEATPPTWNRQGNPTQAPPQTRSDRPTGWQQTGIHPWRDRQAQGPQGPQAGGNPGGPSRPTGNQLQTDLETLTKQMDDLKLRLAQPSGPRAHVMQVCDHQATCTDSGAPVSEDVFEQYKALALMAQRIRETVGTDLDDESNTWNEPSQPTPAAHMMHVWDDTPDMAHEYFNAPEGVYPAYANPPRRSADGPPPGQPNAQRPRNIHDLGTYDEPMAEAAPLRPQRAPLAGSRRAAPLEPQAAGPDLIDKILESKKITVSQAELMKVARNGPEWLQRLSGAYNRIAEDPGTPVHFSAQPPRKVHFQEPPVTVANTTLAEQPARQVRMVEVEAIINGFPVRAFVDSGAERSVLNHSTAAKCRLLEHMSDAEQLCCQGVSGQTQATDRKSVV